jgi:NifU-like protein involved in Fe-S cluster formation
MASATVLYTPQVLALTTALAGFRLDDAFVLRSEARSRSCGSMLMLGLSFDANDRVERVGVRSQACAIGQASAAIFAQGAMGRHGEEIGTMAQAVAHWVAGEGELPDWPDLTTIARARDYPGRHGALLLPWNAALQLLSSRTAAG